MEEEKDINLTPEEIKMPDNAYSELKEGEEYKPILMGTKKYPEINAWTVIWGIIMAIIFSAATAYAGLRFGQVFEAAIPIAIIAVGASTLAKGCHHNIISSIDTYRTVLQMPIHKGCCISITCHIRRTDKHRIVVKISQCNIRLACITSFNGSIISDHVKTFYVIRQVLTFFVSPYNTIAKIATETIYT